MELNEYDVVRVKSLILSEKERGNLGSESIKRKPVIGDIGTIVHVHKNKSGQTEAFIVECNNKDGLSYWISDFLPIELELVKKYSS